MDELKNITNEFQDELLHREFRDALGKLSPKKIGEVTQVEIVGTNDEGVLVDLGMKYEGIIPRNDFGTRGIPSDFTIGKKISVIIQRNRTPGGYRIVSHNLAQEKISWLSLRKNHREKKPVSGKVMKKVKGGLIVDIGVDAFLPVSQIDIKFTKKVEEYIGREIKAMIIEFDERDRDIVISRKRYLEIEREQNRERIFSTLKVEDTIEGTVTNITNFGAFIDLGGVDGLVHISDLAWQRVSKVSDILEVNQKVKLKVIGIDPKEHRISLSLKHLTPYPWEDVEEKYSAGSTVRGKVTHITSFGAFVELEPGIEGLLHISELAWNKRIDNPGDVVKEGQIIELKVIEIDKMNKKLSLSLKRTLPNPWEKIKAKYPAGSRVKCRVTNIVPFGVFVSIENDFEGLINLNDLSWVKKIKHASEIVSMEDEIEAVMLEIKPEEEKAVLSIKHLTEDPFVKYSVGTVVNGTVCRILNFGVVFRLEEDVEAFMHISEMSSEKNAHPSNLVNTGDKLEVKIIRSDRAERKIDVSIKRLQRDKERKLISKYSKVEGQRLGDILEEKKEKDGA